MRTSKFNGLTSQEIFPVASCYRNRDKHQRDGPLGSYADFTLPYMYLFSRQVSRIGDVVLYRVAIFAKNNGWAINPASTAYPNMGQVC